MPHPYAAAPVEKLLPVHTPVQPGNKIYNKLEQSEKHQTACVEEKKMHRNSL